MVKSSQKLLNWQPYEGGDFYMGLFKIRAILRPIKGTNLYNFELWDGIKKITIPRLCGATARKRASSHCSRKP